jgi:hypothetical protein
MSKSISPITVHGATAAIALAMFSLLASADAPTPANSVIMRGKQAASPNPGYIRLIGPGVATRYVDMLNPGGADQSKIGQQVAYQIPMSSELLFSDYPLPPPPTDLAGLASHPIALPTHSGAPAPSRIPVPPLPTHYLGNDGSPITAKLNSMRQILSLSGKSKAGVVYVMSLAVWASTESGYSTPTWVHAAINFTEHPATEPTQQEQPLTFSLAYSPLHRALGVFLDRSAVSPAGTQWAGIITNVTTGIGVQLLTDFPPLKAPIYDAIVNQGIAYYGNVYSSQSVSYTQGQNTPQIFLPTRLALWPFADRVSYFAPALHAIAASTGGVLPTVATPWLTLASVNQQVTSYTSSSYLSYAVPVVGPAIGPLAATFVTPENSGIVGLDDAASWLGWVLMNGPAREGLNATLVTAYNSLHQADTTSVGGKSGGSTGGPPTDGGRKAADATFLKMLQEEWVNPPKIHP